MTKNEIVVDKTYSSNLVFLRENRFWGRLRQYFTLRIDSEL